jgi:hypothetical protein
MKKKYWVIIFLLPIVAISGCGGGCSFPYILNNFVVEPDFTCLSIQTNECTKPELWIDNNCNETVTIENLQIKKGDSYIAISAFYNITSDNEHVILNGTVGNETMRISFDAIKR